MHLSSLFSLVCVLLLLNSATLPDNVVPLHLSLSLSLSLCVCVCVLCFLIFLTAYKVFSTFCIRTTGAATFVRIYPKLSQFSKIHIKMLILQCFLYFFSAATQKDFWSFSSNIWVGVNR